MVQLRAVAAPLLSQVGNKLRNGVALKQEPAEDVEDYERSPEGSTDDEQEVEVVASRSHSLQEESPARKIQAQKRKAIDKPKDELDKRPRKSLRSRFTDEQPQCSTRAADKRKSDQLVKQDEAEDLIDEWKSQQSQRLSQRSQGKKYGKFKTPANIHGDEEDELPTKVEKSNFVSPYGYNSVTSSPASKASFKNPDLANLKTEKTNGKPNRIFKAPHLPSKDDLDTTTISSTNDSSIFSKPAYDPNDSDSSSLSSAKSDVDIDEDGAMEFAAMSAERDLVKCPICQRFIDRESLDIFTNGRKLNFRDKMKFCRSHKRGEAEKEWGKQEYPEIDWRTLEARLTAYNDRLDDLIEGRRQSTFRRELREKQGSGRARKALRDVQKSKEEAVTPGYYGSRGAQLMQKHVIDTFGVRLREMAEQDAVVRTAGVSNYVRAVLVPELAVLLVKDDMALNGHDDERAREILKQSAEVGDLVNEIEEDMIKKEPGLEEDAVEEIS